jgi:hemerythrin-like domain-containing protein
MAVQIGAKPDSGFDDPIGLLKDCHRRIEKFLAIVCKVAVQARGRRLTAEEQTAIESSMRYFRQSGPRHNADEEDSLFPRLRAFAGPHNLEKIAALEHQHHIASGLHEEVDHLYKAWIADGTLTPLQHELLKADCGELKQIYEEHIDAEETTVFPLAAEFLDAKTIAAMGDEFRARRNS